MTESRPKLIFKTKEDFLQSQSLRENFQNCQGEVTRFDTESLPDWYKKHFELLLSHYNIEPTYDSFLYHYEKYHLTPYDCSKYLWLKDSVKKENTYCPSQSFYNPSEFDSKELFHAGRLKSLVTYEMNVGLYDIWTRKDHPKDWIEWSWIKPMTYEEWLSEYHFNENIIHYHYMKDRKVICVLVQKSNKPGLREKYGDLIDRVYNDARFTVDGIVYSYDDLKTKRYCIDSQLEPKIEFME